MFLHPDCTPDGPAICFQPRRYVFCRVSEIQCPQAHTNAQGAQRLHSWPAGELGNLTMPSACLASLQAGCHLAGCKSSYSVEGTNIETSFCWLCSAPPVFLCEGCGWAHTCDEGCRERIVVDVAGVGAGDLVCPISGYCSGRLLSAGEVGLPPPRFCVAHEHRRHSINGLHLAKMCSRLHLINRADLSPAKVHVCREVRHFLSCPVACRQDQTS